MHDLLLKTLTKEETIVLLKRLSSHLKTEHNLSDAELNSLLVSEFAIPVSIFSGVLSPAEAIVKYLKENENLTIKKISEYLGKDEKTVWASYDRSKKKDKKYFKKLDNDVYIPISQYNKKISVLESTVIFLKDNLEFSGIKISKLLNKKPSTVWTAYKRGVSK